MSVDGLQVEAVRDNQEVAPATANMAVAFFLSKVLPRNVDSSETASRWSRHNGGNL
jgi:hypothetical protein